MQNKYINKSTLLEIGRYLVVGGIATLFNYTVFYVLYSYLNVHYQISFLVGFISSVLLGFYVNRKWTFKSDDVSAGLIIRYLSVYFVSIIVGVKLLEYFVTHYSIIPQIGNIFTIGFTTVINFVGLKFFVFKKETKM